MKNKYNLKARDILQYFDSKDGLSISKQTDLLGISRSGFYYHPKPISNSNLDIMNEIDKVYTKRPYYGSRKIAKHLSREMGILVNRKRIQRLMRLMGLEAIYPKPNLSKNTKDHPVFPYLLKGVKPIFPNHIWGTDITYIRMEKGFLYLVAFMDWYSRYVLSWQLSNTLETPFVVEAANEALKKGTPDFTNSDQGVQFTSNDYIGIWDQQKTKISMDGRGRYMDNIFTERLWRSVKYDEVYIKNYQTVKEAYEGLKYYFNDYNYERLHENLNYKTPAEIYFGRR